MRTSFIFLAFFCAIVVIDGSFLRKKAHPPHPVPGPTLQQVQQPGQQPSQGQGQQGGQGGQQAGQQGGQQAGQQGQEPIDCTKFNSDSHLSNNKDCLPSTTVLRNETYRAFCDSTLASQASQGSGSQGNSSQGTAGGNGGTFVRPLMSCRVDQQGILNCWSGKIFTGCFLYQSTELNQQDPTDCTKFNSDSHLSNNKACLPTTTVLRNDTYKAFCDSTLASQGGGSQGSGSQGNSSQGTAGGNGGTFVRPLMSCQLGEQGIFSCWSGMAGNQSGAQGNSSQGSGSQSMSGSQGGMSGNQGDIVGKTFNGCFLYQPNELNQQGSQQGGEDQEVIEYLCIRRNSKQQTTGIVGQQSQQGKP